MVRRLDYLRLPVVASYWWMLAAFVGATAVFHAALAFAWPLGRVGWKVVDYVWLLFGLLGALSGVQAVQQEIATGLLPAAEDVLRSDGAAILDRIAIGASPAVYRTLDPFESAPPDEETARRQRELDEVCRWFRAAKRPVQGGLPPERPLTMEALGGGPVPDATPRGRRRPLRSGARDGRAPVGRGGSVGRRGHIALEIEVIAEAEG